MYLKWQKSKWLRTVIISCRIYHLSLSLSSFTLTTLCTPTLLLHWQLVWEKQRCVSKTHSIHVPLLAALHVFSHGVSLFLADLKSFPQLHDTATEGHAHRLDLRFPILQLNPKHGTIINRALPRLQRREQNSQCSQKQSRLIYRFRVLFVCVSRYSGVLIKEVWRSMWETCSATKTKVVVSGFNRVEIVCAFTWLSNTFRAVMFSIERQNASSSSHTTSRSKLVSGICSRSSMHAMILRLVDTNSA